MAVTIIRGSDIKYINQLDQLIEGRAYMDVDGDIYICNRVNDIVAFSVCGRYVIKHKEGVAMYFSSSNLREINLTITVE